MFYYPFHFCVKDLRPKNVYMMDSHTCEQKWCRAALWLWWCVRMAVAVAGGVGHDGVDTVPVALQLFHNRLPLGNRVVQGQGLRLQVVLPHVACNSRHTTHTCQADV